MKKFLTLCVLGLSVLFVSCKKDNNDNASGQYYYDATIDGVRYKVTIPANNTNSDLEAGSSLGGFDDVVFGSNLTSYAANGTSMGISKGVMNNYLAATDEAFKNFFSSGNYNYAPEGTNGVSIVWTDADGGLWSTEYGVGTQTGSTFSITGLTEERDALGTLYIKVTIQFSCKLYDLAGTGAVKQATGTYVGLFGKI